MEGVLGGVSGRTLNVNTEWGESGSLNGETCGDGGISRGGGEGESTGRRVAAGELLEIFSCKLL